MIIDGKLVGKVMDGDRTLYSQTTELKKLDNGQASINQGYTSLISHSTEVYVDNVVISKPRWISDIKVETEKTIMTRDDAETAFTVYGKSAENEWIKLNENEYTISCTNLGANISDGVLTLDGTAGKYCLEVSAGQHHSLKEIEINENPEELQRIYDALKIENADKIKEDFKLPTVDGNRIIWTSADDSTARIDGENVRITRPSETESDKEVALKATIYGNGFIMEKEIKITVKAEISDEAAVNAAISNVSVPQNTTGNITLPQSGDEDVVISWESSNAAAITADGTVTRAKDNVTVLLIATYSRGSVVKRMTYSVCVTGTEPSPSGGGNGGGSGGGGGGKIVSVSAGGSSQDITKKMEFSDVNANEWFYDAVKTLFEKGIVSGVSDTEYQPNRYITREEFLKLLCGALDISPQNDAETAFSDVPSDSWFAPFVSAAVQCGIANGISVEEFGSGLPITRQDMCVMTVRALEYLKKPMNYPAAERFSDDSDFADYSAESIYKLRNAGIVSGTGDGRFMPNEYATRAEMAVMISNMLRLFNN